MQMRDLSLEAFTQHLISPLAGLTNHLICTVCVLHEEAREKVSHTNRF